MAIGGTDPSLKKALIQVLDEQENATEEIRVEFNPTEYSLDKSITYSSQNLLGLTSPVTQFVSGDASTLSMELFFDTYEEGTDVRKKYTDRLDALLKIDRERHAPPICRFVWASLNFTAVLQSARKRFTAFLPDGTPVRARVDVTFQEHRPPERQLRERPRQSADKTKLWRVTESDTLWLIAAQTYRDPERWRTIADANGIENPRTLRTGRELVIPPLEER